MTQYYATPEQYAKEVSAKQAWMAGRAGGAVQAPAPPTNDPSSGIDYTTFVDSSCADSSMWVMAATGCSYGTGSTPRICFDGPSDGSPLYMGQYEFYLCSGYYCFGPYYWNGDEIGSYWAGDEDGDFQQSGGGDAVYFSAGQDCTNAPSEMTTPINYVNYINFSD